MSNLISFLNEGFSAQTDLETSIVFGIIIYLSTRPCYFYYCSLIHQTKVQCTLQSYDYELHPSLFKRKEINMREEMCEGAFVLHKVIGHFLIKS